MKIRFVLVVLIFSTSVYAQTGLVESICQTSAAKSRAPSQYSIGTANGRPFRIFLFLIIGTTMSIFRRGFFVFILFGMATSVQAEGWNPLSVFKKKEPASHQSVVPASANLPIRETQTPGAFPGLNQLSSDIGAAPANFVDKWNQGTQKSMEKVRKALTLPKISLPNIGAPQIQNENPFLQPLMDKLSFGGSDGSARTAKPRKPLLSNWLTGKTPAKQQPPTLQDWLDKPRPQ